MMFWVDLRKMPTILPIKDKDVIVCYLDAFGNKCYDICKRNEKYWKALGVIAWKSIDEFIN